MQYNYNGNIVFDIDTDSKGYFCNTKFEGLNTALDYPSYGSPQNSLSFDNCEFANIAVVMGWSIGSSDPEDVATITDSKFYDVDLISTDGFVVMDNCLFERVSSSGGIFRDAYGTGRRTAIYNSDIIGDGTQTCIAFHNGFTLDIMTALTNSTVSNCGIGIKLENARASIKYNYIFNNTVGVHFVGALADTVQYNNFMNNEMNIELDGTVDCADCNYNYAGVSSDNQTIIAATIKDICDGYSSGSVTWWPWFLNEINFDDLSTLPNEATFSSLECVGQDLHPSITGKRLNIIFVSDTNTTLAVPSSPTLYYVTNNVVIQEGAILNIPVDVEIIFVADYTISVKGTINSGCNSVDIDTYAIDITDRGLYFMNHVHFHSINYDHNGSIMFDLLSDSDGEFCNTKFEGLNTALDYSDYGTPLNSISFDNCEFTNIAVVMAWIIGGNVPTITDSKFYDVDLISMDGNVIMDNCLFERFSNSGGIIRDAYGTGRRIAIYNSDIIGNGTQTCIALHNGFEPPANQETALRNSTVSNCGIGIKLNDALAFIKYNNISDNTVGVLVEVGHSLDEIQYNNFINNDINFEITDSTDYECSYNYWGMDTSNQSLIASKIVDICDGYSSSVATFWPWFGSAYTGHNILDNINDIKLNAIPNLPILYSFDYTGCASINNAESTVITDDPTTDPTVDPTTDPTMDPTIDPTVDPTTDPTIDPTCDPTSDPSTDPTNDPTKDPTIDPTTNPSKYPTKYPTVDPTVDPTTNPTKATSNPSTSPILYYTTDIEDQDTLSAQTLQLLESFEFVGYGIVGALFAIPIILLLFGLCYHSRQKGVDSPNYFAVVRCFMNIADFYTDTVFCLTLILQSHDMELFILGIAAGVFTFLPHIISISICLVHIQKWRKMKYEYVDSYDNLIIGLTVLAGFYPTVDFLSSKLFHLKETALHLTKAQIVSLKQKRFFNTLLLENAPLMVIQIYSLLFVNDESGESNKIYPITLMALTFSTVSLTVGILTLISRTWANKSNETKFELVGYKFDIQTKALKARHKYVHSTFANMLSQILAIHPNRVETVRILRTAKGISITVYIRLTKDDDQDRIANIVADCAIDLATHDNMGGANELQSIMQQKFKLEESLNDLSVTVKQLKGYTLNTTTSALSAHMELNSADTLIGVEMNKRDNVPDEGNDPAVPETTGGKDENI